MSGFFFNDYPYTDFHEMNLSWIIKKIIEMNETLKEFIKLNSIKYADPIQWNITSQYEANTIVIDPQTGTAYMSVVPVPIGVSLNNTDYWTEIFNLGGMITRVLKNFCDTYEAETTLTATVSTAKNGWIMWGDTLYRALVNITAGDAYVVGSNIAHFTIEDVIGHIQDLTTTDKTNLVSAINEVASGLASEIIARGNADTTLGNSITTVSNNLTAEATTRGNADTALQNSINTINTRLDALTNRRVVVITDSYGNVHGSHVPFTVPLQTYLGLSNSDYFAYAEGSLGFVQQGLAGHNAEELLTLHESDITNHDTISHIIFVIGGNDIDYTSSLMSAMSSCLSYARATYPNARMIIAYSYNQLVKVPSYYNKYADNIAKYYECVSQLGAEWVENYMYIMHNSAFFYTDKVHPNTDGGEALARGITSYLNAGNCDVKYHKVCTYSSNNGTYTGNIQMSIDNELATMIGNFRVEAESISVGANDKKIGSIASPLFDGIGLANMVAGYVRTQNNIILPVLCYLFQGDIYLTCYSPTAETLIAGQSVSSATCTGSTLQV